MEPNKSQHPALSDGAVSGSPTEGFFRLADFFYLIASSTKAPFIPCIPMSSDTRQPRRFCHSVGIVRLLLDQCSCRLFLLLPNPSPLQLRDGKGPAANGTDTGKAGPGKTFWQVWPARPSRSRRGYVCCRGSGFGFRTGARVETSSPRHCCRNFLQSDANIEPSKWHSFRNPSIMEARYCRVQS